MFLGFKNSMLIKPVVFGLDMIAMLILLKLKELIYNKSIGEQICFINAGTI